MYYYYKTELYYNYTINNYTQNYTATRHDEIIPIFKYKYLII